jgi:hypothetical protein
MKILCLAVFDSTMSGAAVANETVIHPGGKQLARETDIAVYLYIADGMPFGGIGASGCEYARFRQ